jgi:MFS family permease
MPVAGVLWAGIQTVGFALTADLLRRAVRDEEQERAQRGLLYGIFNLAPTIGLLLAAPVAGAVIALMHGFYPAIFIVAGVSALLAAVAAFAMRANAAAPA